MKKMLMIGLLAAVTVTPQFGRLSVRDIRDPGTRYDASVVVTVTGTVTDVWEEATLGSPAGVYLTVTTSTSMVDVYLGPSSFLKFLGVNFVKGDKVEVTGSRVMTLRREIILAAEVRKGDMELALRDKNGTPYWNEYTARP